jgi:ADP-dependent NAD(P)H-hydrate dehydratase / NAD(P)H-hydrate epimerase
MKALTAAEMREVDRLTAVRHAISQLQLMENAGKHVADAVRQRYGLLRMARVAVLCGKGNNGGDGLVAARILKELRTANVAVFLFAKSEELRGDAATNLKRWVEASGETIEITDDATMEKSWQRISATNVVVDALLGTGLRGPASGVIASAIERLNRQSKNATLACPSLILAVDTPSGLPSDGQPAEGPVIRAHLTLTFTAPKIGQLISADAPSCGQLLIRSIGSPDSLVEEVGQGSIRWSGPDEFVTLPLVRSADSHKGTFGHALILAGSVGKSGAAILAGHAALRTGAGLVTLATPEPVQLIVAAAHPEYMTEPLTATKSGALAVRSLVDGTFGELEEGKSVLAIGPGLGTHRQTQEFIRTIVAQTELPVVLDADGLNAFAGDAAVLRERKTKFLAITPHPGEMARLVGASTGAVQEDRVKTALESAKRWNAHVILKGFHTVLASPSGRVFVNTTGNAGLAKGGSGDILTGVLAALTSQFGTDDWLRILALGVYLHGAAASAPGRPPDLSGMLAHEIAKAIPSARNSLLREIQRRA